MFIVLNASNVIIRAKETSFGLHDEVEISTDLDITSVLGYKYEDGRLINTLESSRREKITALINDFNTSKKITIRDGTDLVIEHDTPERQEFLNLIENVSNLSYTTGPAFIYKQATDEGIFALRVLPEVAAYIFKDLFVATLSNAQQIKVNSRVYNKTIIYELGLEDINNSITQKELDAVTWHFLNEDGITIDVNYKVTQMLNDENVSEAAKAAINAAKDPVTGKIHLVKTLRELAADSY